MGMRRSNALCRLSGAVGVAVAGVLTRDGAFAGRRDTASTSISVTFRAALERAAHKPASEPLFSDR